MRHLHKWLLALSVVWGGMSGFGSHTLDASTFDETTGRLTLDADFSYGFDQPPDDIEVVLYDWNWRPIDADGAFEANQFGLEGAGALRFANASYGWLYLWSIADEFTGRRVEMKIWLRPEGTMPRLALTYDVGEEHDSYRLTYINFLPTGRATDDGWRELSTGPVDFAYGGVIAPSSIEIIDPHAYIYDYSQFQTTDTSSVLLDAFEIIDLGAAAVPSIECSLATEDDVCGVEGVCQYGRCVDIVHVEGPVPQLENDIREDYVERRIFEIETYDGVRHAHQEGVAFAELMRQAADGSVKAFWPTVNEAFETLVDGHSGPPWNVYAYPITSGMCLYMSEADLLTDEAEVPILPMVYTTESEVPVADALQSGDVLMTIDGLSVEEWRSHGDRLFYFGGDPTGREVLEAPALADAAVQTGAVLTFARCESVDGCSADQLETIVVDTADIVGGAIWSGEAPEGWSAYPSCDFRFTHAVPGSGTDEYHYAGYRIDGEVTMLEINGVPYTERGPGRRWADTVEDALGEGDELILIDERRGDGGYFEAVVHLLSFLLSDDDGHMAEVMPWYGDLLDDTLLTELRACYSNYSDCGYFYQVDMPGSGAGGESAESRVALLLGQDVSGNDFFTRSMEFRAADTRSFGAAPTYGAFGGSAQLPAYIGEILGGGFQSGDSVFWQTPIAFDDLIFESATGVPPDEVIYQRQSDAIQDIDTVLTRAIEWLEEGE